MVTENSNGNQTAVYRFGRCELYPDERLLKCDGELVLLAPKAFDALLCLVRKAGRLVTKSELMATLWPATFVSEASLTNTIGSIRKALGHDAVRTVSKHGYRLELPVSGEPGISHELYRRFVRANELTAQRSIQGVQQACELYWICLAENPGFAPGWAWLGRSARLLAKFGDRESVHLELAEAAFRRAFAIDPDLACAHQFYTALEADTGHARRAMVRLLGRIERLPAEPESFSALVQVFRYCGLLKESIEAHRRARELDPAITTSVPHSFFLAGEYAAAIESYGGPAGGYLDAASWAALGETRRAITLMRDRTSRAAFSGVLHTLMNSLLFILEGKTEAAIDCMDATPVDDLEAQVYLARHYAFIGEAGRAITTIQRGASLGFLCDPVMLQQDPWLASVRTHAGFPALLDAAVLQTSEARIQNQGFVVLSESAVTKVRINQVSAD